MPGKTSDNGVGLSAPNSYSNSYSFSYPASRITPETPFAPSRWTFDGRVTDQFDEMLARSIPQYGVMRRLCFSVGSEYVVPGGEILDLGCSRGEAVAPFVDYFGAHNRFVLCETSEPMREAARERFRGWLDREHDPNTRLMELWDCDIETELPRRLGVDCPLVLSVLTLMFTDPLKRDEIVGRIYDRLAPGGAFILVEKLESPHRDLDKILVRHFHQHKLEHGYTAEEITTKAAALEGVLRPLSARENESLLIRAGFKQIECFWRWMNFGAWVAVK